ncbi:MAG: hypothetical protein Q8784_00270 [Vigna little leaf phytoplasma]|nr:hypothetical protein [Vigna little leaf phytoplasma]
MSKKLKIIGLILIIILFIAFIMIKFKFINWTKFKFKKIIKNNDQFSKLKTNYLNNQEINKEIQKIRYELFPSLYLDYKKLTKKQYDLDRKFDKEKRLYNENTITKCNEEISRIERTIERANDSITRDELNSVIHNLNKIKSFCTDQELNINNYFGSKKILVKSVSDYLLSKFCQDQELNNIYDDYVSIEKQINKLTMQMFNIFVKRELMISMQIIQQYVKMINHFKKTLSSKEDLYTYDLAYNELRYYLNIIEKELLDLDIDKNNKLDKLNIIIEFVNKIIGMNLKCHLDSNSNSPLTYDYVKRNIISPFESEISEAELTIKKDGETSQIRNFNNLEGENNHFFKWDHELENKFDLSFRNQITETNEGSEEYIEFKKKFFTENNFYVFVKSLTFLKVNGQHLELPNSFLSRFLTLCFSKYIIILKNIFSLGWDIRNFSPKGGVDIIGTIGNKKINFSKF